MSTNLDKSLDEILAGRKGGRAGKRGGAGPGPVGGVRKRPQRAAAAKATAAVAQTQPKSTKAAPAAPSSKGDASKIIVSNLPLDIKEQMIKEYFSKAIGHVKTCSLSYGPNGVSRGIATIVFSKNGDAEKAAATYNGVLVDRRPMKVELVLEPKVPGLEARVGAPNPVAAKTQKTAAKPKPATNAATKPGNTARGRPGRRGGPAGRGGRPGRPKHKTEEELDAEMADYWDGSAPAPASGAADGAQYNNAAAPTDAMEDDQVLVEAQAYAAFETGTTHVPSNLWGIIG